MIEKVIFWKEWENRFDSLILIENNQYFSKKF